jgi:asparagine synthase (glutamine-hydrolysing)
MSVQFGRWNFDGDQTDPEFMRCAARFTAKYGPDGENSRIQRPVTMFFQPFHSTNESLHEQQPLMTPAGVMLTWDGRLDSRDELMGLLSLSAGMHTDAGIVLAAYERWGMGAFSKLIGDWALAIWDPKKQALLLAKDFAGSRHLFYTLESNRLTWSTVLHPLVLLAEHPLQISEEFIAGYLSSFPGTHLTPYLGINAVPASTVVQIMSGRSSTHEYWQFDPFHRIHYGTDAEYEQHFRHLFAQSVRRRLRASSPVMAELSGGMDSTSIVCMADQLIGEGKAQTTRVDTISYYDDDEPNWNERPYFSLVEKKRGRIGYHICVGSTEGALLSTDDDLFLPLPGHDRMSLSICREFSRCLEASRSRILLSGIGGDEFLGGVPTPIPELQDLLVRLCFARFARQLLAWSLQQRRPWLHLLFETIEEFLPQPIRQLYKRPRIANWLSPHFVQRNAGVFWADIQRTHLTCSLPSFQSNISALNSLRRQLHYAHLSEIANHRVSYPYLDRDLLAFLFAIPRNQLVRPQQRRSLMRRALADLLPAEIITRRRKAFVARQPLALIESALPRIKDILQSPLVSSVGWIEGQVLSDTLSSAKHGHLRQVIPLLRVLRLELWLQSIVQRNLLPTSYGTSHRLAQAPGLQTTTAIST